MTKLENNIIQPDYHSLSFINITENNLESSAINIKELYYGKEFLMQKYGKQKNVEDNTATPISNNISNYTYSPAMEDIITHEGAPIDNIDGSDQAPYRSRCNTWPRRLPPHQQNENKEVTSSPSDTEKFDAENIELISLNKSYSEEQTQKLNPLLTDPSTEYGDGSSAMAFDNLQSNTNNHQQTHLTCTTKEQLYSPLTESPLTNQISGSFMLSSHQPIQSNTGGTSHGIVESGTETYMSSSPVIPIPGAPNLDNSSLASYATLSLSSGPLPLLSEEDMVLDSDVLSFTKDCIIPGFGNTAKETNNEGHTNEGYSIDNQMQASPSEGNTKSALSADGAKTANNDEIHPTKEKEVTQCNSSLQKILSTPPSNNASNSQLFNVSPPAGNGSSGASRRNAWGNLSYADLITQAIKSSPDQRLTLAQIYEWLVKNITHFREKSDNVSSLGWKVSTKYVPMCSKYVLNM